ncbi:hypothetical protein KJA15_01180 [Patescibacteria group bacterium]|nr:hypothetical protein [Patescibacteria group bacterium]
MLYFYAIGVLIAGAVNTFFGCMVYFRNKKALPNILYGFLSLAFAVWCYAWVAMMLLVNENVGLAYFLARLLNLGAIFIPIFYFHWVLSVLGITKEKKKIIILGYVVTFVFTIFSWTSLYIKGVHPILFFPYWPTAGSLYKWYLIFGYFTFVFYGLYLLLKYFIKTTGDRKNQIKYVILGSLMGFGAGAVNFPLMYGVNPFGYFSILGIFIFLAIFIPFPIPLSYAVIKYHLMDIRVILTELLVGVIALILLVQAFAAETLGLKIFGFVLLGLFGVVGYFLIKSILREIELRAQLEVANVELERLDKARAEFISIASHQLRTPLTAIKGYISMVLEKAYGKIPGKIEKPLKNVYESNKRLTRLVNDLLSVSRIESGRLEMKFEKVSLEDIISSIVGELKTKAKEKKLYLKWEKPKISLPKISIDRDKIRQVILNVIDNAIKYTEKGGIKINLKSQNSNLRITVEDTGVGLTKEESELLFESFVRGKAGVQFWTGGAGLGLYISKKFVEMHKGKVWVESEGKGKGSTFYIELPVR